MVNKDKRQAGRRKRTRRTHDMLRGRLTDDVRHMCDMLVYGKYFTVNRRTHQRRAGGDRRSWPGSATAPRDDGRGEAGD